MTNIINDISTLTTIPVKTWDKLVKKTNYCICDAVLENTLIDEDITAVDLGIGVLYIKRADLEGNIIKYRFEPSPALDKAIKDTIINKQNLLEDMILTNLKEKFDTAYKNLC